MEIENIIRQMTLEEKAAICSGRDFWHTKAVERLGIPSVMMCDGPHGLRKQKGVGDHLGMRRIIEHYGGSLRVDVNDGMFKIDAIIPNP